MKKMLFGLLAVVFFVTSAQSFSLVLNANQILENNQSAWNNPTYSYQDDTLYATALGTANGLKYLRVGLEDHAIDTTNLVITGVTIYVRGFSSYSKSKARLRPYFNGVAGLESPNLNMGTSEVLRSFDISTQNTLLPDGIWNWQDLRDLSIRFTPRTAALFSVDHIFAVVTYRDTTVMGDYRFEFSPIATPQTLGYYFPIIITARDSLGTVASSYNGSANLSDSTMTVLPIDAVFVAGICSMSVMIGENTTRTAITVDDGNASSVSNGFAVVSGLYQFFLGTVASPQYQGIPFAINLAAADFNGDTLTSYTGRAGLSDLTGTLSPDSTGNFVAGLWAGSVTVFSGAGSYDTIWASSSAPLHTSRGRSNGFLISLPSRVKMSWLVAESQAGRALIRWRVESEDDCQNWLVQRAETSESGFQTIGQVKGRGTINEPFTYSFKDEQALPASTYYYRLVEIDGQGRQEIHGPVSVNLSGMAVSNARSFRCYPNPSKSGNVAVSFSLPAAERVNLRIYNIVGELVATLADGKLPAGIHQMAWNGRTDSGRPAGSGVFILRLESGSQRHFSKITVLD